MPRASFWFYSFDARTMVENKKWNELQEHSMPSYYTVCEIIHVELGYRFAGLLAFFGIGNKLKDNKFVNAFTGFLAYFGIGWLFSKTGCKVCYTITEKYMIFFCVCLGIWTEKGFQGYEFPTHNRNGRDISELTTSFFTYTLAPRAVLLQIIPELTFLSVFVLHTVANPLPFLIFSKKLHAKLQLNSLTAYKKAARKDFIKVNIMITLNTIAFTSQHRQQNESLPPAANRGLIWMLLVKGLCHRCNIHLIS